MTDILIVEDETITAFDLKIQLEKKGYNIIGIEVTGEDAVYTAAEKRPDLTLMDINLKGEMSGIEASKKILALDLPVVYLTANSDKKTFSEANIDPAYGFIRKPYIISNVVRTIEFAINRAKIETEKIDLARGLVDKKEKDKTNQTSADRINQKISTEEFLSDKAKNEYLHGAKFVKDKKYASQDNHNKKNVLPKNIRILIVEDEMITAMDIKNTLEKLGYEVVGISVSSDDAIASAKKHMPDIILMDIYIKGNMNGIEVSEEIETLNIPIIFLTANTNSRVVQDALKVAPYGYIKKPFNKADLERNIEVALQKNNENINKVYAIENKMYDKNIELKIEKAHVILILSISLFIVILGILTLNITWLQYVLAVPAAIMIVQAVASLFKQDEPIPYEVPPYVTIIVPAHNEEYTIADCVESLGAMDYYLDGKRNYELIVVNDGSTDNTAEVLNDLKKENDFIKIITRVPPRSGKGKGFVLNDGLQICKGEIIAVFDADARVDPDFLSVIIPYLNDDEVEGVQSRVEMYNKHENFITHMQHIELANFGNIIRSKDIIGKAGFLGGNGQLVKKDAIIKSHGWDGFAITEDLNLSVKLMIDGAAIRYCGDVSVYQEAVSTWKLLFRQRERWSIGNFETLFIYSGKILGAKIPAFRKFGILEHVAWYGLNMLIFFGFIAFITNIIGWFFFSQTLFIKMDAPLIIGIISAVGFTPGVLVTLCRDHYSPLGLIYGLIGYWLYSFHLIPLFFITFYHMLRRQKRTWAKTEHKGIKATNNKINSENKTGE